MDKDIHYLTKSGWIRAAILGANDGILSTASIIIGVTAASATKEPILLAGVAGLVAGALSMAAGEYVSVSSQTDIEHADIERERQELFNMPEMELMELAAIYEARGLDKKLAHQVAEQLTKHDALGAHARDELGIHEITKAQPLQAAFASGAAFTIGGILPVITAFICPIEWMVHFQYAASIIYLIGLGILAARMGGSSPKKAVLRITLWGTIAMIGSALIGYMFDVNLG